MAKLEVVKTGYDPKNRPVIIIKEGKRYQVKKTLVGFESVKFDSLKTAIKVFNEKVLCSQNQ